MRHLATWLIAITAVFALSSQSAFAQGSGRASSLVSSALSIVTDGVDLSDFGFGHTSVVTSGGSENGCCGSFQNDATATPDFSGSFADLLEPTKLFRHDGLSRSSASGFLAAYSSFLLVETVLTLENQSEQDQLLTLALDIEAVLDVAKTGQGSGFASASWTLSVPDFVDQTFQRTLEADARYTASETLTETYDFSVLLLAGQSQEVLVSTSAGTVTTAPVPAAAFSLFAALGCLLFVRRLKTA